MYSSAVASRSRRQSLASKDRLRITEIFYSLQGESRTVGWPTVFVRLTGCPLRCSYCDTAYAFHHGRWMLLAEIEAQVATYQASYVTVTGGEPLAQPACSKLLGRLCNQGYRVSLETSGALDISAVDNRVVVVLDLKTPGSGEVEKNRYQNLACLAMKDQVKFVVCDRRDYEWSKHHIEQFALVKRCEVLLSPSHGMLAPATLADWILADRLQVRMQIQLHKYVWGDIPGH